MHEMAIRVSGLSKQYVRGPDGSLPIGQMLARTLLGPYRRFRGRPSSMVQHRQKRESFWALRDVNFDVRRGERIGIIGRNGAGKSTLLKILARIVYPTEGEARIRGRLASLLEVGTGFNPRLTGRENVYLNMSIYGLDRREIDRRMDEIVEFSGVRDFLDTPMNHYSSGMFMRLAFSVAAHIDPDILLLDEVLAVGDLSFQRKCLNRVEGLASEGRTIVFVSHSMDAITRFCTRCLWLEQGRIVKDGPAQEVTEAYLGKVLGLRSSCTWGEDSTALGSDSPQSGSTSVEVPLRESGISVVRRDGSLEAPRRSLYPGPSMSKGESSSKVKAPIDWSSVAPPGDEFVRLVSVRVVDSNRVAISSIAIDQTVGIEVVYDILGPGKNIQPVVHFKTPEDTYIFVVAYTDPAYMWTIPKVGRYEATAWVPPNLLNAGIVYVSVIMATPDPMERHCVVDRVVSVNVYERLDGLDNTARGLYARGFPGVVRPKLEWQTRQLSDQPTHVARCDE